MSDLQGLKAAILADGKVDAGEAAALRAVLFADGAIDQEEADVLFEINDAVTGHDNAPEWAELFRDGISAFVLGDAKSPGEIDEDEANYLVSKIQGDGQVDATEKMLLEHLKANAKGTVPANLAALFEKAAA